jgi:hypothetical protein
MIKNGDDPREIERARSEGVTAPRGFRNARRSVGRRQRDITQISRRPISRDAKRAALCCESRIDASSQRRDECSAKL